MVSEEDYPEHLRVTEKLGKYNEKDLDNRTHLIPEIKIEKLATFDEEEQEEEKKSPETD